MCQVIAREYCSGQAKSESTDTRNDTHFLYYIHLYMHSMLLV